MHTLTVWNRESTNFNANAFVRANGTGRCPVETEVQALDLMSTTIHNPGIDRAVLESPNGRLPWEKQRHHPDPEAS